MSEHAQISAALAIAQGKFQAPKRSKPVTVRTKTGESYQFAYAPLDEIIDAVKQPLAENGLSWVQYLQFPEGKTVLNTEILHASGERLGPYPYPVLASRDGPQGFASGVTYARRYGLSLALGIAPEDDDDAAAAEGNVVQPAAPKVATRRPRPPAENVMVPHDPQTGEVMERPDKQIDEEYLSADSRLMAAAQGRGGLPAMGKLREEWDKIPPSLQTRLKANLAGYKSVATQVDMGFEQAQG